MCTQCLTEDNIELDGDILACYDCDYIGEKYTPIKTNPIPVIKLICASCSETIEKGAFCSECFFWYSKGE